MATPTIIATAGAVDANSFGTRIEADLYHDSQLHTDAAWPANISATATIGTGVNGTVTITVDTVGTDGNLYTVAVALAATISTAMSALLTGSAITVTLGTTVTGIADPAKNTALLVAAAVNALTGITAVASGTGTGLIPVTALKSFTGGSYQEETKNPALIMAAQWMTSLIEWTGYSTAETQALPWPRIGMMQRNGWAAVPNTVVPTEVKNAQFELARLLIHGDRTVESDIVDQGITALKTGPIALTFREYAPEPSVIPDVALNLLVPSWVDNIIDQKSGTRELVRA